MSMSTVGSFIATLTVPALNLFMISTLGWQAAWRVWGIILLIVFVPAVLILGVNRPEDIGLVIDNGETVETTDESIRRMNAESFTVAEAVRTKEFWFLGIISAIPAMFTTGLTFHFFSMMSTKGINNEAAAVIIGLIAFPSFLMPILARPVVDRFKTNRLLTVTLMMMVLSMVFLVIGVTNQVTAIVFILFYGLSIAIQGITLNVAWPNYFGRKHLGSVRGAATVFMVLGSALGPMPFGINADLTGDYDMVVLMMAAITLMVTMTTFFMRKPIRPELI
ncbi:MAG: MFS transporter [Acholeplasmataceae bacterium]|nr:MFS transporter [Acholeplasmataceae bacterium]